MTQQQTSGGRLSAAPVQVFVVRLDDIELAACRPLLDPSEAALAGRMTHADTRTTFIKSRALLRTILSDATRVAPADLRLIAGANGKPELADAAGVHFSMSHSCGMALIVLHGQPNGVDIERVDEGVACFDLAHELFSAAEQSQLSRMTGDAQRTRQFFRTWTRKEALLKAMGLGFAVEPRTLDVAGAECAAELGWHVRPLAVAPAWEAALATADAEADVRMMDVVSLSPFRTERRAA